MPELPEVEVSRQGLVPHLEGQPLEKVIARRSNLRLPIPESLDERLRHHRLESIQRRGKYLLFHWPTAGGWLILHLGMSGSLRLIPPNTTPGLHDHFDLVFPGTVMRLKDPRRFGLVTWQAGPDPEKHPLLSALGLEPLSANFTTEWLIERAKNRQQPIKQLIMDAHALVGVGNIYAAESLFRSGISPLAPAGSIAPERLDQLVTAIRDVLSESIARGGSSVRNYVHSDGGAGSFQLQCQVYGRANQPCLCCKTPIHQVRQGGRSSFYCPECQK